MLITSVTSKGQVTIPARLRAAIGLHPGDKVDFIQEEDRLILKRHENNVAACFGLLKASRGASLTDIEAGIEEGATT